MSNTISAKDIVKNLVDEISRFSELYDDLINDSEQPNKTIEAVIDDKRDIMLELAEDIDADRDHYFDNNIEIEKAVKSLSVVLRLSDVSNERTYGDLFVRMIEETAMNCEDYLIEIANQDETLASMSVDIDKLLKEATNVLETYSRYENDINVCLNNIECETRNGTLQRSSEIERN